MSDNERKTLERRTVLKGAAWATPVIAVAAATPFASASTAGYDVGVAATCEGNYDLSGLLALIADIPLVGSGVAGVVQNLLAAIGLTPFESRGYRITAVEGTVPQGTQFTLNTDEGLIDLDLLDGVLATSLLGLVSINGNSAIVELQSDLEEGESTDVALSEDLIDIGLTANSSMALIGNDTPGSDTPAPNSASLSLVSVDTNLSALIGDELADNPVTALLAGVLGALSITIQLCPGEDNPVG